jgi:uncharacterized protein YndB with AHSA1/START domain
MNRPVTLIEPGTLRLERLLPGPIERVWAYRIRLEFDNSKLSREGAAPEKYRDRQTGKFDGVITRLEPPRLLAHTWMWNGGDTEVAYQLAERGSQVLLTVVHRRLGKELVPAVMSGWDVHSGILEDVLKGAEPRPFWTTHSQLEREYAAAL